MTGGYCEGPCLSIDRTVPLSFDRMRFPALDRWRALGPPRVDRFQEEATLQRPAPGDGPADPWADPARPAADSLHVINCEL